MSERPTPLSQHPGNSRLADHPGNSRMSDHPGNQFHSDRPVTEPRTDWITKIRRKVDGRVRAVWRAQAKIGTYPGTIALFFSEPVEGQPCELVEDVGADVRWKRPRRVTIDRIDDVSRRIRCSLR